MKTTSPWQILLIKTWHSLHLQRQGHLNTGTLYRYNSKSYKFVSNYFDWHYLLIRRRYESTRITSGIENFVEMQLFRNLFNPFFYTFSGQFRLTVFVDSQTDKVVVICQTFDASNDSPQLASDQRWLHRAVQ